MNYSTFNFTTPETSTNSTTPPSRLMGYLEISVYSIGLLFGLPTQSYVLWLIVTGTGSGIALEFFNLNLSVCELGICLNGLVFVLSLWFSSLLKFELFLVGFSLTGRPVFQSLICVERYLAVVHPVTFLKSKPLRYRLICCTAAWMFTLFSCFFCAFYISLKKRYIHTWLLWVQVILILSIQLFCLVAVLKALKRSGPGDRRREEENHMKRKAFQIILINTLSTVIMYVPQIMTSFVEIVTGDSTPTNSFTAMICFTLTGFVHPVLYLHRTGKLQ